MDKTNGEQTVERLLDAFQRLDVEAMVECFTPDGAYHAMGMESAVGTDALRALWLAWAGFMSGVTCQVHRQLADDKLVMQERTDHSVVGDRTIETFTAAMYDIDNEGHITAWREYFDDPRTP